MTTMRHFLRWDHLLVLPKRFICKWMNNPAISAPKAEVFSEIQTQRYNVSICSSPLCLIFFYIGSSLCCLADICIAFVYINALF